MLETAFSLPTQEFQKLVGKCNTIPLLDGVKIVGDPSTVPNHRAKFPGMEPEQS
jgi:hypothetical protein